jgi:D-arabinose 1-dehydrogenase-like Zn-dependent alcohol dehydrogenase
MGHENIGTIAKAGSEFLRRKGFKEGDLVFVKHYVICGKCECAILASIAIARKPTGAPIRTRPSWAS